MVNIRIDKKLKKYLDSVKIQYLKQGKKPPSYNQILKGKIKKDKKQGILYDEAIFY